MKPLMQPKCFVVDLLAPGVCRWHVFPSSPCQAQAAHRCVFSHRAQLPAAPEVIVVQLSCIQMPQ